MAGTLVLDTIAAISTPPGRGGIGIVRLSGPEARPITAKLVRLSRPLEDRQARFVAVLDPDPPTSGPEGSQTPASPIDQAIVTAFFGPQSYTGEDVVEIAAHGAPVVLDALLSSALRHGARLAGPGEFTQRAFLAGRLDLTQAEAVHDLIAAQTLEQARAAAQQLGGALSRRLAPWKELLLQLIALLEAGMDFASGELDDVDVVPPDRIATDLARLQSGLAELAASFRQGALLRNGVSLALIGPPNAGKSSLFNRLLERPRAIVTPIPGTTRDTVEDTWVLHGIPVRLVDTAGLRLTGEAPADEVERLGIERSREALADADLVLLVHDATLPLTPAEDGLLAPLQGRPFLHVDNKVDLLPTPTAVVPGLASSASPEPATAHETDSRSPASASGDRRNAPAPGDRRTPAVPNSPSRLSVSALTGVGIADLRTAILAHLQGAGSPVASGALNNRRQQASVVAATTALEAAEAANLAQLPHEILLIDLHNALTALDDLTGTTTPDDILNRIFSTFCIGK